MAATASRLAERNDRGVVAIGGADAAGLVERLITTSVEGLAPGEARFAALLTPQGKVSFDFFVTPVTDGFLVEIGRDRAADLLKRLALYRLRAAVTLADRSDDLAVFVAWDGAAPSVAGAVAFADPRLPALGTHLVVARDGAPAATASLDDWHRHRIGLGVPESGIDFALGDVFPHDVDMDDLAGVDFTKGCFVGQEVVSRMKHRGTARKRFVVAVPAAGGALPAAGTEITAGEKAIGTLGSSVPGRGLAAVRLDRAAEAMAAGEPITAGGVTLRLDLPSFARFGWPQTGAGG